MRSRSARFPRPAPELPVWFLLSLLLLVLVKLWLVSSQTVYAIGPAIHDDRLFLSLAEGIANEDWLGPYNERTLAKGPFYPMWVAFSFLLGVPLLLSQHLLYTGACLVATQAVRPLVRRLPLLLGIFAFLLFNPISFDTHTATRIIRAGIYPALTLLSVGTAIGLLLRVQSPTARLHPWAIACGLSVAAFWLTREEGVWLLPFLLPILAWTALRLWRTERPVWTKFLVCAMPLLIPLAAVHGVSLVNKIFYDEYASVDFKTHEFRAAYGALSRVKHARWVARIPVPKEVRLRIYEQSPAFAELKPFFESRGFWTIGPKGAKRFGPGTEDKIGGSFFMWALREAVSRAGYYRSGATSGAYYKRLAEEINSACEEHRLDCLAARESLMPPWREEYIEPVLGAFSRGLAMLIGVTPLRVDPVTSAGTEDSLKLFQRMTGERLSPRPGAETGKPVFVRALAAHAQVPLSVTLIDADGQMLATAEAKPSPKVESYFTMNGLPVPPHANRGRFEVLARCEGKCRLQIGAQGRVLAQIPLRKGTTDWFGDPLWVFIEEVGPPKSSLNRLKLRVLAEIGHGYQFALPVLVVLALLAYGFHSARMVLRRTLSDLWVITSSLAAAVIARLVILALIHATAFPAINTLYLAAAYPLLLLTVALMLIAPFSGRRSVPECPAATR